MIRKIKSIYNKDDFDYSKGIIDPYEFHKTFYYFIKVFRVLDKGALPKWTYITQTFIIINTITAFLVCALAIYGGILAQDILRATEAGAYTIIMLYKLLNLSCTKLDLPHYHNFLRAMREDFHYVCTDGEKYRKRFFQSQLETWKYSLLAVVFLSFLGICIVIFACALLFFFLVTHEPGSDANRPLLIPLWAFEVDFFQTPIYEITFFYTNYTVLLYAFEYIFAMQTGIVWVRQITIKADLMIYRIQDLMDDYHTPTNAEEEIYYKNLLQRRLKEIVLQHHSMYRLLQDFAGVYKKLLMFEQKLGGPVVCLTAYGSAEKFAVGEFHIILVFLCIGTISMLFIPSYLCTFLGIKIRSICDACWNIKFWQAPTVLRPYLVLIMQRSLRPLPLQAPGFQDISLKTFSSNMASAYSLFNMLRQTNVNLAK